MDKAQFLPSRNQQNGAIPSGSCVLIVIHEHMYFGPLPIYSFSSFEEESQLVLYNKEMLYLSRTSTEMITVRIPLCMNRTCVHENRMLQQAMHSWEMGFFKNYKHNLKISQAHVVTKYSMMRKEQQKSFFFKVLLIFLHGFEKGAGPISNLRVV